MADIASRPALAPRRSVAGRRVGGPHRRAVAGRGRAGHRLRRKAKVPPPFGPARERCHHVCRRRGHLHRRSRVRGDSGDRLRPARRTRNQCSRTTGRESRFVVAAPLERQPEADDIVVVGADGTSLVVVTPRPISGGPMQFEWAPDSKSLLVDTSAHGAPATATLGDSSDELAIWLFDATAVTAPRVLAGNATSYKSAFRPPDGKAILMNRPTDAGQQLLVLDVATGTGDPARDGRSEQRPWRGPLVAGWDAGRLQLGSGARSRVAAAVRRERRRVGDDAAHEGPRRRLRACDSRLVA